MWFFKRKQDESKEKEPAWDQEIISEFPILYDHRNKSSMQAVFGLECDKGWAEPIRSMSAKLETLNLLFYPKYRIRIKADQIKEKYGTLRVYTSVIQDHGPVLTFLCNIVRNTTEWLKRNVDYGMKEVEIHPTYTKTQITELKDKSEFLKEQEIAKTISNVEVEEKNGKYLKKTTLIYYRQIQYVPTKRIFVWELKKYLDWLEFRLDGVPKANWKQNVISEYLMTESERIIKDAENECYNVCEKCGRQIGTEWSTRCETAGHITYICDKCAANCKNTYYKNGALYLGSEMLKSKDEVDAEREAIECKYQQKIKENTNDLDI